MTRDSDTKRWRPSKEWVTEEVRRRIASGAYAPHTYLPAERELAKEFGTGRSAVRLALSRLESDGLVVQTQGRGTRVLPPHERLSVGVVGVFTFSDVVWAHERPEGQELARGVQETLTRLGCRHEIIHVYWPPGATQATFGPAKTPMSADAVMARCGAALFRESFDQEAVLLELERRRFPVVVANLEVDLNVSATWTDHAKATRRAMRILLDMGHRRIALLTRDITGYFYPKVFEAYRQSLAEAGIAFDEALVARAAGTNALAAYVAIRPVCRLNPPPTAILAARDILAEGAYQACAESGLVVGRDISIFGYDDVSWGVREPFLTTFREPEYAMGSVAAEMLMDRIVNGWRPPEQREIEAPLVFRRSVAPLVAANDASNITPDAASAAK